MGNGGDCFCVAHESTEWTVADLASVRGLPAGRGLDLVHFRLLATTASHGVGHLRAPLFVCCHLFCLELTIATDSPAPVGAVGFSSYTAATALNCN